MKLLRKYFASVSIVLLIAMLLAGCGKPVESNQPEEPAEAALYAAGTHEASAPGNNGDITVSVTFADDKIEKVEVTKHQETSGIADPAIERIPQAIVDNQSLAIDAVSGATMTSKGILEAVEKAVVQANGDVAKLKEKVTANVSHEKVEKTFDVIVVGGGGAGISAAAAAAQNGVSVAIVEKTAALGGNTIASGFAWNAVNPETQSTIETKPGQIDMLKEFLEYDEKDFGDFADTLKTLKTQINTYLAGDTSIMFDSEEFHMIQTYLGGKRQDKDGNWIEGNYDLLSTLVKKSLETNKWVRSLGGKYSDLLTSPVGSMWLRGHNPEDKKQIFDALSDFVLKQNDKNEIMLETRAEELIVENGRVAGVKATKVDGTEVVLHANKGVILTTGGYGANAKLAAEYNNYWPSIPEDMKTTNVATATGDGIIMGKAVGANLVGMEFIQLMPTANEKTGALTDGLLVAPQNYIFVNKEGKRFINEYAERDTLAFAALEQPGEMFYTIADQDMAMTSQNRPTQEMIDKMVEDGIIYRADTLEGLAEIIGCDAQTFVDEINKYNSYVDNGKDPDFGKPVFEMKVLNGPFYACPAKPAIHHTMGGLQINTNSEVLNTEGKVIPGLYAAGEVTGGIHAGNRLGGNAIADIFVFGRIAGENASK